jgi:hypothetical protein
VASCCFTIGSAALAAEKQKYMVSDQSSCSEKLNQIAAASAKSDYGHVGAELSAEINLYKTGAALMLKCISLLLGHGILNLYIWEVRSRALA